MGSAHAFFLYAEWLLGRPAFSYPELYQMNLRVMEYGPYFFPEGYIQTYGQLCTPTNATLIGNDACSVVVESSGAAVPNGSEFHPLFSISIVFHFPILIISNICSTYPGHGDLD